MRERHEDAQSRRLASVQAVADKDTAALHPTAQQVMYVCGLSFGFKAFRCIESRQRVNQTGVDQTNGLAR
jgi:hypothetical protein